MIIRAHHGMCMLFFGGRGYDEAFTLHMAETIEYLKPETPVRIGAGPDELCMKCPNNSEGSCLTGEKALRYDAAVLGLCGIEAGSVMPYGEFSQKVKNKIILPGKRGEVCADCEWDGICRSAEEAMRGALRR